MTKGKILIAEDDAVLRSLYEKKFSIAGYELRTAADGQEALDALAKEAPDLMLLDVHMPKYDGYSVLERYPRAKRNFPIILLTNLTEPQYRKRAAELGADNFFEKHEMTIGALMEMVEQMMAKKSA